MTSGVPQGSNLGSLIFLISINDLPEEILVFKIIMFADNTKMLKRIVGRNGCSELQIGLDKLYECTDIVWLKTFSISMWIITKMGKCKYRHDTDSYWGEVREGREGKCFRSKGIT